MSYIDVPTELTFSEICGTKNKLSAKSFKRIALNHSNYKLLSSLLLSKPFAGKEVGSLAFVEKSDFFFLRTKAIQSVFNTLDLEKNNTIAYIKPKYFYSNIGTTNKRHIDKNDILFVTGGGVGEVAIAQDNFPNCIYSSHILKLNITNQKLYVFSFLKHSFCKTQANFSPEGSIKGLDTFDIEYLLNIKIPYPKQNIEKTIQFVEILTQSLINKELEIKNKHKQINTLIDSELKQNQKTNTFNFEYPSLSSFKLNSRIDAGFHGEEHKRLTFPTINYKHGYKPLDKQGLKLIPGPSLEIKLLGTRIDSDIPLTGFYRLITPKQIQNYGTVTHYEYIGTPRKIAPIQYGDILFGESGTGRTMVYLNNGTNTINNAHAHILRPIVGECTIEKAITIRSILQYYKEIGITDHLTVGGSGGHLSPSYFDRVYIPEFPISKQCDIAILYHNPKAIIKVENLTLENFLQKDNEFNTIAGITELDYTMKKIKEHLNNVLDSIVKGIDVIVDFNFISEIN